MIGIFGDTKTWMFGTTSDLSKEIIKNLDNPICFGRHNVDYNDPDKFIKEHVVDNTPVNICVNVFIDAKYDVIETLEEFKEVHNRINTTAKEFKELLYLTEQKLMIEIRSMKNGFAERVGVLEKWRYLLIGGCIILGLVLSGNFGLIVKLFG